MLDIPVEATWLAIDLFADDHPLFVGRPGSLAPRGANFAMQNSDFLLALGARMDVAVTGYSPELGPRRLQGDGGHRSDGVGQDLRRDADADLRRRRQFSARDAAQKASIAPATAAPWKHAARIGRAGIRLFRRSIAREGAVSIYHLAEVIAEAADREIRLSPEVRGLGLRFFCWLILKDGATGLSYSGTGRQWDLGSRPALG